MILLWNGIVAVWNGKPRASGDDPHARAIYWATAR